MDSPRVLNIDNSGKPVGLIPWHRAATLIWNGKATPIETVHGQYWNSPSVSIPKSIIIQTHEYVQMVPLKNFRVMKRVLFSRDQYKCQYCGKELTRSTATIDHLRPKASFIREGRPAKDAHTYTNCVTACAQCNTKKGDRYPHECGMRPLSKPLLPTPVQVLWSGKVYCPIQAEYISMYFKVDKDILLAKSLKDLT